MLASRMKSMRNQGLIGIDIAPFSEAPTIHLTQDAFGEMFPDVVPEVVDDFAEGRATQYRIERDGVIYFYIVLKEVV
jgi:hypothetical protein